MHANATDTAAGDGELCEDPAVLLVVLRDGVAIVIDGTRMGRTQGLEELISWDGSDEDVAGGLVKDSEGLVDPLNVLRGPYGPVGVRRRRVDREVGEAVAQSFEVEAGRRERTITGAGRGLVHRISRIRLRLRRVCP